MYRKEAVEEYSKALKEGKKECRECVQKRLDLNPAVLEAILARETVEGGISVGRVESPVHRIIGTVTAAHRHLHEGLRPASEDSPHQGFEVFLDLIDEYRPQYFLHGHVHLNYGGGVF